MLRNGRNVGEARVRTNLQLKDFTFLYNLSQSQFLILLNQLNVNLP